MCGSSGAGEKASGRSEDVSTRRPARREESTRADCRKDDRRACGTRAIEVRESSCVELATTMGASEATDAELQPCSPCIVSLSTQWLASRRE